MFKNFLVSAVRNLYKQKGYFFINILGLAIGLTSFIFIALYVLHELSYDRFHENYENIYRVKIMGQMSGQKLDGPITAAPMAKALLDDYPEVEQAVRLGKFGSWLVSYKNKTFIEEHFLFADSSFFKIFSYKLLEGDPNQALVHPRSVVVSKSYVKKYFGNEDPMGKLLRVEQDTVFYTVTGIIEDAPENSHIKYDLIGSMVSLRGSHSRMWVNHNYYTYVLLKKGTNPATFENKMQDMVVKYLGPQLKEIVGITLDEFEKMGNSFTYQLQALKDIHLKSNLPDELEPNGNMAYVKLFSIIAILILIIAIINFVNLSTAKSTSRAKEVGIRKTIGATKKGLISQFIGESIILTFIAIFIAIALVGILTPSFNQLIGRELSMGLFDNPINLILLLALALVVGIFSGIYPAFVLAAFQPIKVLKGSLSGGAKSGWLRSILVVIQFIISITIIIGTIVVYQQLNFMQTKELGFDKEQLLILKRPDALKSKIETFKKDLLTNAYILGVSNSVSIPGKTYSHNGKRKQNDPDKNTFLFMQNFVSLEYPEVMGLALVQGRFFSHDYGTDSSAVIVNEAAIKLLKYEDPLNSYILDFSDDGLVKLPIIGVVKNYNIETLHKEIAPSILTVLNRNSEGYMEIRLNTADLKNTMEFIEKKWNSYVNDMPYQYFFFDEEYNRNYETEMKTGQIFSIFAFLAIFIACLGLLGLITYAATVRTKEIGIRKVHGASVFTIVKLLSTEIVKLILIATAISWIIAYFWIDQWLSNFAYHVTVSPFVYISATLIALIVGWLAIGYQAIKIAYRNPIDALRYE